MPVSQNLYAVVNCGFWLTYGLLENLPELVIPNILMEIISISAIVFYIVYRRKYYEKYGDKEAMSLDISGDEGYGEMKEVVPGASNTISSNKP